jgi:two-component SAPR family response regulator
MQSMRWNCYKKKKQTSFFLDIHLPKLKGLRFYKDIKRPTKIIITTAYQEYALQGYELNVLDFLLKPIEFSRFVMAVNKLKQQIEIVQSVNQAPQLTERGSLFFYVGKKKVKIFLD